MFRSFDFMGCKNTKYHAVTDTMTPEELAAGLVILVMQYCLYVAKDDVANATDVFNKMYGVANANQDRLVPFVMKHTSCPDCKAKLQMGLRSHN